MPTFTFESTMPVPADDLFAWHERPGALKRLLPPWSDVEIGSFEGIRDGQQAVLRVPVGPIHVRWIAEHHDYMEGRQFCDRQVKGLFSSWNHTHRMVPSGTDASRLIDHIEYAPPLGWFGEKVAGDRLRRELQRQFGYRHRVTERDLMLHQRYKAARRPLRLAVSGASGLIGSNLVSFLRAGGHTVRRLVRQPTQETGAVYWNPRTGEIEAEKLEALDAVVHLAAESVYALRWTQEKKARILRSRVEGTRLLSTTLAGLNNPPGAFLAASAIGYYGNRGDDVMTETSDAGERGFLTAVTREWEAAVRPATEARIRTVLLRIGVALSPQGGLLDTLLPLFRLGLGGRLRHENPWISWIALDDVLGAIYHVLMTHLDGPVNVTAPNPVPMQAFAETLARVLHRPAWMRVPPLLARLAAGELAEEALLVSARVVPEALEQSGYVFAYPNLEDALRHQLGLHKEQTATAQE